MYLSHVVRTMRDDPTPAVETTLLVRLADGVQTDDIQATAHAVGGEAVGTTEFGAVRVRLAETEVAAFLDELPPSVEAVETDAVTGIGGDAGEDV